jgi:uncharacterized protein (TIGR02145 family)
MKRIITPILVLLFCSDLAIAQSSEIYSDIENKIIPKVKALNTSLRTYEKRIDKIYDTGRAPSDMIEKVVTDDVNDLELILIASNGKANTLSKKLSLKNKTQWASKIDSLKSEIKSMQGYLKELKSATFKNDRANFSKCVIAYNKVVVSGNKIQNYKSVLMEIFMWEERSSLNEEDEAIEMTAVGIGGLEWADNNLNVAFFRNGDPIPEAKTASEWEKALIENKPAWCYYMNSADNRRGKLYNKHAVNDARGLAPKGWRIATTEDWISLFNVLGDATKPESSFYFHKFLLSDSGMEKFFGDTFKAYENGYRDAPERKTSYTSNRVVYANDGFSSKLFYYWRTYDNRMIRVKKNEKIVQIFGHIDADKSEAGYSIRCVKE